MSFSGLLTNFQIDEALTTWPGLLAGEATVMIREQAANEWCEHWHWPLRAEGVSGVRIMTTGARGDEDDMNTEARHGHGDDA